MDATGKVNKFFQQLRVTRLMDEHKAVPTGTTLEENSIVSGGTLLPYESTHTVVIFFFNHIACFAPLFAPIIISRGHQRSMCVRGADCGIVDLQQKTGKCHRLTHDYLSRLNLLSAPISVCRSGGCGFESRRPR
jgi:hypothetical protein